MAGQLARVQHRVNTLDENKNRKGIYVFFEEHELDDCMLPLTEFHPNELKPTSEVIIHGYRSAVISLPNTDPDTQEDLGAFRNSVRFSQDTLQRLLEYTFAHCVYRQCLQLHHPDNDLS